MKNVGRYPKCFPPDFETRILPKGAKKENIAVYRVIKYGTINRDGFLSTFEEVKRRLIPQGKRDMNAPGTYSTSCNIDRCDAEYALSMFMRHHPKAFIAIGKTEATCGPCQRTREREPDRDTHSHVDWWIYEDAEPQKYFNEDKTDE